MRGAIIDDQFYYNFDTIFIECWRRPTSKELNFSIYTRLYHLWEGLKQTKEHKLITVCYFIIKPKKQKQ